MIFDIKIFIFSIYKQNIFELMLSTKSNYRIVFIQSDDLMFQNLIVASLLALIRVVLSLVIQMSLTKDKWPLYSFKTRPDLMLRSLELVILKIK